MPDARGDERSSESCGDHESRQVAGLPHVGSRAAPATRERNRQPYLDTIGAGENGGGKGAVPNHEISEDIAREKPGKQRCLRLQAGAQEEGDGQSVG